MRRDYLDDPTLFLHFCDYPPFEEDLNLHLNKLEFPSCKIYLYQVWLKLARCFILKDSFQYTSVKIVSPLVSPNLTLRDHNLYKLKSALYQIDWLPYLRFYVPLKNFSLIWRRHHCRWRAAKFRPILGAQGLWAGRDLYRATPAVTWDLSFSGLIRRTASFSCLLRHTRGCGGSILTRILTGSEAFM
jgi:hypothetical protein